MLQRIKRRRGGQPGNRNSAGHMNALKHGRYSPRIRAERLAEWQAEAAEERKKFAAYLAPIEARCRLQHERVMAEIRRERRELGWD